MNSKRAADEPTASLCWEIKSSFRDYVIGVGGTIGVTAPAAEDGSAYRFPSADGPGGSNAASGDLLRFTGTVRFSKTDKRAIAAGWPPDGSGPRPDADG